MSTWRRDFCLSGSSCKLCNLVRSVHLYLFNLKGVIFKYFFPQAVEPELWKLHRKTRCLWAIFTSLKQSQGEHKLHSLCRESKFFQIRLYVRIFECFNSIDCLALDLEGDVILFMKTLLFFCLRWINFLTWVNIFFEIPTFTAILWLPVQRSCWC